MSDTVCESMDFVYATHSLEYADAIGRALLSSDLKPDVVALEWAEIGNSKREIDEAIPLARKLLDTIVDGDTPPKIASAALRGFDPFNSRLLKPLIGSNVEIALIDAHGNPELSKRSTEFNNHEQDRRVALVVRDERLSIDARKEEMLLVAGKAATILAERDALVTEQLSDITKQANAVAVFQGSLHSNVAETMRDNAQAVTITYVPELVVWPGQTGPLLAEKHLPSFQKLIHEVIRHNGDYAQVSELAVERALLSEYIANYIGQIPSLKVQTHNTTGLLLAASRIAESLPADRVQAKLKAALKALRQGTSLSKVIAPILPKHHLNVLADQEPEASQYSA